MLHKLGLVILTLGCVIFSFTLVKGSGGISFLGGVEVKSPPEKVLEFGITENDTLSYTIKLVYDQEGKPSHYLRNIFTPVCFTGECKPVYINFYWDLLGNYMRYDLPGQHTLTKMDHDEFKPEDYEKLQTILINKSSILKETAIEDLVGKGTDNLADSVDAKTGATLKTIKNEVIEGAVYTCYTLWKIAHGRVVGNMEKITDSLAHDGLFHDFLRSSNHYYQYWAMEKVMNEKGKVRAEFLSEVLGVISGKNIFASQYALQKIEPSVFLDQKRQLWLWQTYLRSNYALQLSILKKLSLIPLSDELQQGLSQSLVKSNREQFVQIIQLLSAQPDLSEAALLSLAKLLDGEEDQARMVLPILEKSPPKSSAIMSKIKKIRAQYGN